MQVYENQVKDLRWKYHLDINITDRFKLKSCEWMSLLWEHDENEKNRGPKTKPQEKATL